MTKSHHWVRNSPKIIIDGWSPGDGNPLGVTRCHVTLSGVMCQGVMCQGVMSSNPCDSKASQRLSCSGLSSCQVVMWQIVTLSGQAVMTLWHGRCSDFKVLFRVLFWPLQDSASYIFKALRSAYLYLVSLLWVHGIRCIVSGALYQVHCIRCIVSGALYQVHCIRCIVSGALYQVHGIRCIVSGALYQVHCIRCIVSGALYQVHCI